MKITRAVIFNLCFLLLSNLMWSAPLKFVPQKLLQPNGEIINCFVSGDEYYRWLHDKDGYTIIQNAGGYFVYASKQNGLLVPTPNIVGKSDPVSLGLKRWLNLDRAVIQSGIESRRNSQVQLNKSTGVNMVSSAPTRGQLNNLVVFIRFADEPEFTEQFETFNSMLNNTDPAANSLRHFYAEVSNGQLQIRSNFYPLPVNNAIKSYVDPNVRNYYKSFSVTNLIGYKDGVERTAREQTLLTNAVNAVKGSIDPSDNLDADNDGNVDNVCFIAKGSPEVWSDLLWPHMWSLESKNVRLNGKKITTYNFQLENSLLQTGVGVLCHEMFHSLGAPDLYHYSLDGISPLGEWDLMDNTLNPPQHMNAYMKFRYGHWIDSIPTLGSTGAYSLSSPTSGKTFCVRIASPNSSDEFFVLEYRKKEGVFEQSLPSEGLLVYRINKNSDGLGNASGVSDEVYVYRPGGSANDNGDVDKASLGQNVGRDHLDDYSDPYASLSNGTPGGLDVSNIGPIGESIAFTMKKTGAYTLALTSPVGGESFKVNNRTLITWINTNISDIRIQLMVDGVHWTELATVSGQSGIDQGQFLWNVPATSTSMARIRISDLKDSTAFAMSRSYFTISQSGQLFESEPNNTIAEATPIAIGDVYEGDIDPEGDADYYKFIAAAGDTIDVFANAKNSSLFGRIQVLGDNGFIAYGDGVYDGLKTRQRLSVLIPSSGTYTIRHAFRENWGSVTPAAVKNPVGANSTGSEGGYLASASGTVGKYQISLRKFKTTPPDFGFGGPWYLTQNSVILYWDVQENGCPSKYTFEYGTSNYYTNQIDERATTPLPLYQSNYILSQKIFGLMPNTTYHFRIRAENEFGTFYSKDASFMTANESTDWERQLVDWDGGFQKFISFGANDAILLAGGDGGLFKTRNGGRDWGKKVAYPNGFFIGGASFLTIDTGWIVGNLIFKTTDGGTTWVKQDKPTVKNLSSVCFVDELHGTAVGGQGIIIHTIDGGTNWNVQDPGTLDGMWERLISVAFCDKNNGIATGTSGTILRTTNEGATWTKQSSGTTASLNGVHMLSSLVATTLGDGPCGGAGNILHTTNGGITWVNQNNPTGNYLYSVDYLDANVGLGVGINGAIARTTDGGNTWVEQESGIRSVMYDVKFVDASTAYVAGNDGIVLKTKDVNSKYISVKSPVGADSWSVGSVQSIQWQKNNITTVGIAYSTDGGKKWTPIADNVPASFNVFAWLVPNVPSEKCFVKVYDIIDSTRVSQNPDPFQIKGVGQATAASGLPLAIPSAYSISQNYPNPFNPSTVIRFGIPKTGSVKILIYNMLGQEVDRLIYGVYSAGYHEVSWNASNHASGVYICTIEASDNGGGGFFRASKKLVLMK